jgi:hypothetical protein
MKQIVAAVLVSLALAIPALAEQRPVSHPKVVHPRAVHPKANHPKNPYLKHSKAHYHNHRLKNKPQRLETLQIRNCSRLRFPALTRNHVQGFL